MTDEQIQKAKYKCVAKIGIEGLTLSDLFIRSAGGAVMRVVLVKKDEYIPVEAIDFSDLKKSRIAGALKACIESGLIVEEIEGEKTPAPQAEPPKLTSTADGITEVSAGIVDPDSVTNKISEPPKLHKKSAFDPYPEDKDVPIKKVVDFVDSRRPNSFSIDEDSISESLPQVTTESFKKLKYFQKLKAIKESKDVGFLKEVATMSSTYPQIKHNVELRLKEIGV